MSDFLFVAAVTGAFFVFGVTFGVLAVIASAAVRTGTKRTKRNRARRDHAEPAAGWVGWRGGWTTTEAGWEEPPRPDDVGAGDTPPRWPGGA